MSPRTVRLYCTVAALIAGALSTAAAQAADAERGRALYEKHCVACHTPGIHRRAGKLPMTRTDLRLLVDDFRRVEGLPWTPEETEDVVEYLNRTYYQFAPRRR